MVSLQQKVSSEKYLQHSNSRRRARLIFDAYQRNFDYSKGNAPIWRTKIVQSQTVTHHRRAMFQKGGKSPCVKLKTHGGTPC
jgi:molybdopterin synthase catalytic subunit